VGGGQADPALRAARHASLRDFPARALRYAVLSAAYWALLLYGSDRLVAVEIFRPGQEVLRLSLGQFALRLARWSSVSAAWTWARTRLRADAAPTLVVVRNALQAAFGAFSQLCVAWTFLETGPWRDSGRETPRTCCSVADFAPRDRPMRPAEARRVLGVGMFADAASIKKAYRKLALRYHPDKLRTQNERAKAAAEREFLRVQEAHVLLTKGEKQPPSSYR